MRLPGERGIEHLLVDVLPRRALAQEQQPLVLVVVGDMVRLAIEHELAFQRGQARLGAFGFAGFGGVDFEQPSIDLVHGEKSGGHSRGGFQESAPRDAQLLRHAVRALLDARLHRFLFFRPRPRQVFAVGHDLRGNRRSPVLLEGALEALQVALAEPMLTHAHDKSSTDGWRPRTDRENSGIGALVKMPAPG